MDDSASTMTVTKATVILDKPGDWDDWLYIVKTIARDAGILDLVGLGETAMPVSLLQAPKEPLYSEIKETAIRITDLDQKELDMFKVLYEQYKVKEQKYQKHHDKQQKGLKELRKHIQNTVSRQNLVFLHQDNNPREMIATLRLRIAPTDRARELELIRTYQELKKSPMAQQTDVWLNSWEKTYKQMTDLGLPDVHEKRPLFDFLLAIKGINPMWAETQEALLNQVIENKGMVPTIYQLIANFRNHLRLNRATEKLSSHSSFVTLNGETKGNSAEQQTEQWTQACICKQIHRFSQCPYFVEKLRTESWKADPQIEAEIEEKKEKDNRFRKSIERIQKTQKSQKKDENSVEI